MGRTAEECDGVGRSLEEWGGLPRSAMESRGRWRSGVECRGLRCSWVVLERRNAEKSCMLKLCVFYAEFGDLGFLVLSWGVFGEECRGVGWSREEAGGVE